MDDSKFSSTPSGGIRHAAKQVRKRFRTSMSLVFGSMSKSSSITYCPNAQVERILSAFGHGWSQQVP